ncbi:hypothetical protein ACS0TY_020791 [Phlomoides rotata]
MGLRIQNYMGFYHIARCGAMVMDCHHITALVERWRSETHTFHFPIGEATVTLQDVAIIWGLHIDGDPLSIDEHHYTADVELTRIKLSAISSHLLETEIFDDTDQEIVDQYARGCVLLMFGSYMMPDSSRSHVSLLYLQAMENIAHAGTYSWGRAVWTWSRIPAIQPTNRGDRLLQTSLEGFTGRNLGLPPYGHLNIAANEVTTSSTPSVEALKHASYDVVRNASHLLGRQPLNYEPYITEPSTVRHCAAEPSTTGHYTVGPSTQEHYPVW